MFKNTRSKKPIREHLIDSCELLRSLGNFIKVSDFGFDKSGIVIVAPHDAPGGTPLSDGHDVNTGRIAEIIAEKLPAKSVVVSELRTFIDINKNLESWSENVSNDHPGQKAFKEADTLLKLYYQSQIFSKSPGCIVEIHGHNSGNFEIEVSTGFPLNEDVRQDLSLIHALRKFQVALSDAFEKSSVFEFPYPKVGIYPLDSRVKFVASKTLTFNKIEKLRELGFNIAGLHIEIHERYRPDKIDKSTFQQYWALADCLKQAIKQFNQQAKKISDFEFKDHLYQNFTGINDAVKTMTDQSYRVQQIPRELLGKNLAVFNATDIRQLNLNRGEQIVLSKYSNLDKPSTFEIWSSESIRSGNIGLEKKYRDLLKTKEGDGVYLARKRIGNIDNLSIGFLSNLESSPNEETVIVGNKISDELKKIYHSDVRIMMFSMIGPKIELLSLSASKNLHERAVVIPEKYATQLKITYGDLICFAVVPKDNRNSAGKI